MSNDQMPTKPTIETVLERMNEWGEQSRSEFAQLRLTVDELRKGQDELRKGQDELRKGQDELRTGQDQLRQTVDGLSKGQDELRKGQDELQADLHANLHLVAVKIQALNDNLLTVQANMRNLVAYIERLELGSLAPR